MAYDLDSDYILDQLFGYQTANRLKNSILALASARLTYDLGGSREVSLPLVGAAQNAVNWQDIILDSTNLAGLTRQLRVECRTNDGATSITPKLRNITDGTDAGVGVACTATDADFSGTDQIQTITVTLAAGVKKYRLMGTPSNGDHATFVRGYLELFGS
jgi:hypothetical protein